MRKPKATNWGWKKVEPTIGRDEVSHGRLEDIVEKVLREVLALCPAGSAALIRETKVADPGEWHEFRVRPAREGSAEFGAAVSSLGGPVWCSFGQGSRWEVQESWRSEPEFRTLEDELRALVTAIIKRGFVEVVWINRGGAVVKSEATLEFESGPVKTWASMRGSSDEAERVEYTYAPYCE